jgi:hypothetical protein
MLPPQMRPASGDRRLNNERPLLSEQIALIKACVAQAVASEVLPLNTMLRCSNQEISMRLESLEEQIKQAWNLGNHDNPEKMSSHVDCENHFRFDSLHTGQGEMSAKTNRTNQTNSAPAPALDTDDKDSYVVSVSSNPPLEINLMNHDDPPCSISSPDVQTERNETLDRVGVPVSTTSNIHELKKANLAPHLALESLLSPRKMERSPSLAHFTNEASRRAERSSSLLSGIRSIKGVLLFNNVPTTMYRRRDMARKVPACFDSLPPCLNDALRSTLDNVFGISDPNIWVGHPGSSVVHPNSLFNKGPPTFSSRKMPPIARKIPGNGGQSLLPARFHRQSLLPAHIPIYQVPPLLAVRIPTLGLCWSIAGQLTIPVRVPCHPPPPLACFLLCLWALNASASLMARFGAVIELSHKRFSA